MGGVAQGAVGNKTNLEIFNKDQVPINSERTFSGCILDMSFDTLEQGEFYDISCLLWQDEVG